MTEKVIELSAALGTFVPARLHITMIEEVKNSLINNGHLTPKQESIFVHEQIHFFQTAFTGYGQIVWNFYREAVASINSAWEKITVDYLEGQRLLPLGHIAKTGNVKAAANAFFYYKVYSESMTLQILRNYSDPRFELISDYNLQFINEPWQIEPTINVRGCEYKLHGKDILESHAKYLEGIYSYIVNQIPFKQTMDFSKLNECYWKAFCWFIQELGAERANEFPLICDLALQTVWTDPPKTEKAWQDSHPAWRFVKLTAAAKSLNGKLCKDLEAIKLNYSQHADSLLELCDYELTKEVMEQALSRYDRRECGTVLPLEDRMKDPLLYRLKYPWCGANPFLDLKIWAEMKMKFVPPLLQIGHELQVVPANGEVLGVDSKDEESVMIENSLELHLQAFVCQIIGVTSNYLTDMEHIQCGYGYFGIKRGCAFQKTINCLGSFNPCDGLPVELSFNAETISGCQFGMFLLARGIDVKDLDLNFWNKKMIDIEELADMVNKSKIGFA